MMQLSNHKFLLDMPVLALGIGACCSAAAPKSVNSVLREDSFRQMIGDFNRNDRELYQGCHPNATAWDFNLPDKNQGYEVAWKQLMDRKGFFAPFGPTTTEQRHPGFQVAYNGPPQQMIGAKDYFDVLKIYTKSHQLKLDDGRVVPWIDENLNPGTGDWISRTRLKAWKDGTWDAGKGGEERGKDYNHSTYCDLVISGLIGLRPRADATVEVNPLVPQDWEFFCLDRVSYHGHLLTILWDRTGQRYHKGMGLRVLADGREIAASANLGRVTGLLSNTPLDPPP